ncbi:hypothetical protein BGX28_005264 [Mortierella sp. GBA30]|nr:hypothetical protein BGX28_005264 [Mortierella sp. GBA30]
MDLLLAHSSSTPPGYREPTRNDCCLMHPATMLDLHVPALGLVSIEHAHLHDGAEAFIQCLPLESIPRGAIYLPRWMLLGMDADKVQAVRVQGIDVERPLDVADKVVVVSYPFEGKKPRLDHWIKPTHANNADLIRRGRKGRQWTENLIKLAIDGQAVSIGSVLAAKIKGQGHRFRVVDIVFKRSSESNVGVVVHDTILEIGQETASKSTQPSSHCGMDGLVQEICSFINDSFSRMDAYTLLNIPNKKAAIITGVAGSGKKALISQRYVIVDNAHLSVSEDDDVGYQLIQIRLFYRA